MGTGVIGRSGLGCQLQWVLAFLLSLRDGLVCEVSHRICRHENIEGTLDVPYGEGGMISHQLCVLGDLLVDEDGDGCDVPVANIYKT